MLNSSEYLGPRPIYKSSSLDHHLEGLQFQSLGASQRAAASD
jgi:hypothetical protein